MLERAASPTKKQPLAILFSFLYRGYAGSPKRCVNFTCSGELDYLLSNLSKIILFLSFTKL